MLFSRRQAMIAVGAVGVSLARIDAGTADTLPAITVNKDPDCSCCAGWVDHLQKAGFPVTVVLAADLKPLKVRLGVPDDLTSCHTAQVEGYVIEGHVPASAIRKLLAEKPAGIGLAVPGMPAGSPGMGGEPEMFEVVLFAANARRAFARYRGTQLL